MKVLIGLLLLATLVVATVVACEIWSPWIGIPAAVIVICYLVAGIVNVQPNTAVIRCDFRGRKKELREGWHFVLRPLEWIGTINGANVFSLQNPVVVPIKLDVEAEDGGNVKLEMSLTCQIADLLRKLKLTEGDFLKSIQEYVKAGATDAAHMCKNSKGIYEKIEDGSFEDALLHGFRRYMPTGNLRVEQDLGIQVLSVIISDAEQPEEVKKAAQEALAAEMRAQAEVNEAKGLAKAAQALQGRVKKGAQPAMSKEKAVELELIRSGKIKKENREVDIGSNLAKAVDGIPKGFLGLLGSMFGPKGGKRKGKKGGGP